MRWDKVGIREARREFASLLRWSSNTSSRQGSKSSVRRVVGKKTIGRRPVVKRVRLRKQGEIRRGVNRNQKGLKGVGGI